MKELKALNNVAVFHTIFGLPIKSTPQIPEKQRVKLRVALLEEELQELKDAINKNDIVEVADALCDIQYVLSGAVLEFGLGDIFNELFEEVQRSNVSKACKTKKEVIESIEYHEKMGKKKCYYVKKKNKFLIYRKEDGKLMKSIKYSLAKLDTIISKKLKNNGQRKFGRKNK